MEQLHQPSVHSSKKTNSKHAFFKSRLSWLQRTATCRHPVAQRLCATIKTKKTNIAVAADVTTKKELYDLIERVGPYICLLKTHIDILKDFDTSVIERLQAYAKEYDFLIFEDRKFADIGNTVQEQYAGGIYQIAQWADIINAHIIPGPGIIKGLKTMVDPQKRALLLLAQMSSQGNMCSKEYTARACALAEQHPDFVMGFIAQQNIADNDFLYLTPGIQLEENSDTLGQQYNTPERAMERGSDILIVGRGVYQSEDPQAAVKEFQKRGWQAYQAGLSNEGYK